MAVTIKGGMSVLGNVVMRTALPAESQATATAQTNGTIVTGLTITYAGTGYTSPPVVTIIGGDGTATATATISNGSVDSLTITNPGTSGYTTATVVIAPPVAGACDVPVPGWDDDITYPTISSSLTFTTMPASGVRVGAYDAAALSETGSLLVCGAPSYDDTFSNQGAVWIFAAQSTSQGIARGYQEVAWLTSPNPEGNGGFGTHVSVSEDGNYIAVGAPGEEPTVDPDGGRVYIYEIGGSNAVWDLRATLISDETTFRSEFGWKVALTSDGSGLLVSAHQWGDGSAEPGAQAQQGRLEVFTRSGSGAGQVWSHQLNIIAPVGEIYNYNDFGWDMDMSSDGTVAIVGALNPSYGPTAEGAYIYTGADITQLAFDNKIDRPANIPVDNYWGYVVAVSNDGSTAMVSAEEYWEFAVYDNDGTKIDQIGTTSEGYQEWLGSAMSSSGSGQILCVGAAGRDGTFNAEGGAYVYTRQVNDTFTETRVLAPIAPGADFNSGYTAEISCNGNSILITDTESNPNHQNSYNI